MSRASLAIRNARIVDGTGAPAFQDEVAVYDGKIIAVGRFDGSAVKEIDAGGHMLSPGFIDIHTHFDPQLCWDRLATPRLEDGVTTVVVGNCSLSLAPVHAGASRKLVKIKKGIRTMGRGSYPTIPRSVSNYPLLRRRAINKGELRILAQVAMIQRVACS